MHGTGQPLGKYTSEIPQPAMGAAAQVAEVLLDADRVLVLGHAGADGDVVGSTLALALALDELGKDVTVYNAEPYAKKYAFLDGAASVVTTLPAGATFDVTVVCDAAKPDRLGPAFPAAAERGIFVWIDHHRIDHPPGDLNYVDLTAAAVGEQIAQVLDAMGHAISERTAKAIYVSLMSDTGGFRYQTTSSRALRLAARLVEVGVNPWHMTQALFESQPVAKVRLLASALSSLELSPCGRFGTVVLGDDDLAQAGADEADVHGIVNHVRGIEGIQVGVLLRSTASGVRAIIRSAGGIDIAAVATALGGKGSMNAARLELGGDLEKARASLLQALRARADQG